jgi:DNA-binding MarR family transcriptional regulator
MTSDLCALDWIDEIVGVEGHKEKMLEWLRQTFQDEDDTLNQEAIEVAHLFAVVGWMERRLFSQQLAVHDLTIPQFFTLLAIHHRGEGCTMGELAEITHQCSPTMTGIIDRLLKMRLVERNRAENDRRLVLVQITESGKHVLQEALRTRFDSLKTYLLQFDDTRREQFIQLLRSSLALMRAELEALMPPGTSEYPLPTLC